MKETSKQELRAIRPCLNGAEKYCRIPIRRKRTPLYAEELEGILYRFMTENGVSRDGIKNEAKRLFELGEYENSGLMLSALDFLDIFERIDFVEEELSVDSK